jgi:predicted RNase H-like HicB family nuclease
VTEFRVIIEQDETSWLSARVRDLPDCHAEGESIVDVLNQLRAAIRVRLAETGAEIELKLVSIEVLRVDR